MPTRAQVEEAIARLGDLGVDVHISELDVPVWYLGSTLERKLARQAAVYGTVAAACQAQPACFRITTWGFMDRYTWRQPWDREPAAAVRCRVPAEAGVAGDSGGAASNGSAASAPASSSAAFGGAAHPARGRAGRRPHGRNRRR